VQNSRLRPLGHLIVRAVKTEYTWKAILGRLNSNATSYTFVLTMTGDISERELKFSSQLLGQPEVWFEWS
jgi:hypothetical protein